MKDSMFGNCFYTTYLQSVQGRRRVLSSYSGTVRSSLVEHWRRIPMSQISRNNNVGRNGTVDRNEFRVLFPWIYTEVKRWVMHSLTVFSTTVTLVTLRQHHKLDVILCPTYRWGRHQRC